MTALSQVEHDKSMNKLCEICGLEFVALQSNVARGRAKYCSRECFRIGITVHGYSRTRSRTYKSWISMRQRCLNRNNHKWSDYGGRGISVCDRWGSFINFLADMGERPKDKSLDRKDVNGNYEPSNCRWATATEQAQNARSNVLLTFRGRTMRLTEWARLSGIKQPTLSARLNYYGFTVEEALTMPVG